MEARVIEARNEKLRVFMSPREQKQFIRTIKTKCDLTWNELGRICGVKGETVKDKEETAIQS